MNMNIMHLETAGYTGDDKLHVNPNIVKCGRISDGVGFEHNREGGWVLAFTDLVAIYKAAKKARE